MDTVIVVQLVICVFFSIHVVTLVLNIGEVDAMVVVDAMVAAGHHVIQHVNIVKVIVILVTQDSTYNSIFRAGNGK